MTIEVGSVLEGTVTGITKFGAFVELPDKKVGLVHISEVANEYVKDVHDFLKVQDKVNVKVLSVDDKGKIGLSIKQTQPAPEKKNLNLKVTSGRKVNLSRKMISAETLVLTAIVRRCICLLKTV